MKGKSIRQKMTAAALVATMAVALVPRSAGDGVVRAATTKNMSNTCLKTSMMASPAYPVSNTSTNWSGSFAYYGNYNGAPMLFRVLDPHSTAYGTDTLFLDSDIVLFKRAFDNVDRPKVSQCWDQCELNSYLNSTFLNDCFTSAETSAIAASYIQGHDLTVGDQPGQVSQYAADTYHFSTTLNGEWIFILDAEEMSNTDYGYSVTNDESRNRIKNDGEGVDYGLNYYIRSLEYDSDYGVGWVTAGGALSTYPCGERSGIAPALNVDLSSVVFSTLYSGEFNTVGAVYTLTVVDPDLGIGIPLGQQATLIGSTVSVPYVITGANAGNATRASVLITDGEWDADGSSMLLYQSIGEVNSVGGTFDLPSGCSPDGWGTNYHVYILAEDLNSDKLTDYSSVPFELTLSNVERYYDITVNNGGSSVANAAPHTEVTIEADPAPAFREFAQWQVVAGTVALSDPSSPVATFFMPAENVELTALYTNIMYNVTVNNGSSSAPAVVHDASVTITADPPPVGKVFDGWVLESGTVTLADPSAAVTTFVMTGEDVVVTATYRDIVYNVSVVNGSSDVATAVHGATVTITADTASAGREFDHWEVEPGALVLDDALATVTTFTMPTEDVQVTAFYRDIPVPVFNVAVNNGSASAYSATCGTTITLTADAAPDGKVFNGWVVVSGGVTLADAAASSTTFVMPAQNVEVTATYRDEGATMHTVSFESNGGSAVAAQTIADGSRAVKPADPTRDGYVFDGWCQDAGCGTLFDFDSVITGDVTLYARWVSDAGRDPAAGGESSGGGAVPMTGEDRGRMDALPIVCFLLACCLFGAAVYVRRDEEGVE